MSNMLIAQFIILSSAPAICASLGGKAIRDAGNNHRLLDIDNYAYMSICGHESEGTPNVTVMLIAANNETNKLRITKYNIFEEFTVKTYIENMVSVVIHAHPDPWKTHRFNPKKITIRYGDQFYKLHFNVQCLQGPNYWTSVNKISEWSKKIDCKIGSVICDDNTDMMIAGSGRIRLHCPIGTIPPVTNIIFKNGVDRYRSK